jgi:hydrogenase nickel incorporation protein HypB
MAESEAATRLREGFARAGVFVLNLISAPGSGKTELVARTAELLGGDLRIAAVAGDVQTELDAKRIALSGVRAIGIETHGACHLKTADVERAARELGDDLDLLIIENVGNLVCPSSFDLGEDAKVALVSLPEGDDKPAKYPSIFAKAGAFVVTKTDLAGVCDSDIARMTRDARVLNPGLPVFELSAKTGAGMELWCDWLRECVREKRGREKSGGSGS